MGSKVISPFRFEEVNQEFLDSFYSNFNKYDKLIPDAFKDIIVQLDEDRFIDIIDNVRMIDSRVSLDDLKIYKTLKLIEERLNKLKDFLDDLYEMFNLFSSEELDYYYNRYIVDFSAISSMFNQIVSMDSDREATPIEEDNLDVSSFKNFIVFTPLFRKKYSELRNDKSGYKEDIKKDLSAMLIKLSLSDYNDLRQKGVIHHAQDHDTKKGAKIDGNAVERLSNGKSKLVFWRIPVKNIDNTILRSSFNNDESGYVIAVLTFDSLLRTGGEKKLYDLLALEYSSSSMFNDLSSISSKFDNLEDVNNLNDAVSFIDDNLSLYNNICNLDDFDVSLDNKKSKN